MDSPRRPTRRRLLAAAGASLTALLAGCGGDSGGGSTPDRETTPDGGTEPTPTETPTPTPTPTATATPEQRTPTAPPRLRAIDLSLAGEKELSFGDEVVTTSFQTLTVTEYREVEPGDITVRAAPYGSGSAERTVSVRDRGDHTVVLFGVTGGDTPLELRLFEDRNDIAPDATPRARLINGAIGAPDLRLEAAAYNTDSPMVGGVGYGEATYGEFPDSTQSGRSTPVALNGPDSNSAIERFGLEAPPGSVQTVLAAGEYEQYEPLRTRVVRDV
jgi:hypothetical protein